MLVSDATQITLRGAKRLQVDQRAKHDINIDVSFFRMTKRPRQGADNLEPKLLPNVDGGCVRRNDKVKLHCAKTKPARFAQTMFAHRATNSLPARVRCNHERGVRHVRSWTGLIWFQDVGAHHMSILFGNVRVRAGPKPICQRLLARHVRINCVSVPGSRHDTKNLPDRVAILVCRWSNLWHDANNNAGTKNGSTSSAQCKPRSESGQFLFGTPWSFARSTKILRHTSHVTVRFL